MGILIDLPESQKCKQFVSASSRAVFSSLLAADFGLCNLADIF